MSVHPPITWFGGKSKLAPRIVAEFPPHRTYCEPFGGSAAVLLAKAPSKVEVYNDIDGELVNLFRVLRDPDQFAQLRAGVEHTLYARAEFALAKEPADDPVERARRFIVRQRQSHGGLGRHWSYCVGDTRGGMASAVRRWQSGIERLPHIHMRVRTVQIEQADWRTIMTRFEAPGTLFYLDPPYVPHTRSGGRYQHELSESDHHELVARLLATRAMVVLSGYANDAYRALEAAGWVRRDYSVPAYISDKRSRRVECLWLSPSVVAARAPSTAAGPTAAPRSASDKMREGAYQTHRARSEATAARLAAVIRAMRLSGERVTVSAVAAAANMSREHVSRKYRYLLEV